MRMQEVGSYLCLLCLLHLSPPYPSLSLWLCCSKKECIENWWRRFSFAESKMKSVSTKLCARSLAWRLMLTIQVELHECIGFQWGSRCFCLCVCVCCMWRRRLFKMEASIHHIYLSTSVKYHPFLQSKQGCLSWDPNGQQVRACLSEWSWGDNLETMSCFAKQKHLFSLI